MFFVLIMVQRFFGDASYAIIGPYIAEVWPNRLRASGMGFSYGIGNLGKIIGPLGLALIVGSSNYVSPKVTLDAIFPALLFLAFWYALAPLRFWLVGSRRRGARSRRSTHPWPEPYQRSAGLNYPAHTETRSRTCGLAAGEPPPTCVPTYRNPTISLSGSRPRACFIAAS